MTFNSALFFFFFLPFLLIYSAFGGQTRAKIGLLCLGGLIFYSQSESYFILILCMQIFFNYLVGRQISKATSARSNWLTFGVAADALFLVGIKVYQGYWDPLFFPPGISFVTFTSIAYLAAVSREEIPAARPLELGAMVSFFPTLLSGPLIRPRDFLPELKRPASALTFERIAHALLLVALGLFKKSISDTIVVFANNHPILQQTAPGGLYWFWTAAFMARLYADFSGYSDIAIGIGYLLGFNIPANFNLPFLATSIGDFWRRWHMTLGHWIRELVYTPLIFSDALVFIQRIPLFGKALFSKRDHLAVLVSMVLFGLWHGLTINYALWGLVMGILLSLESAFGSFWSKKLPMVAQRLLTLFLILNGYVIFMNPDIKSAGQMFLAMYNWQDIHLSILGAPLIAGVLLVLTLPHMLDYLLLKFNYFKENSWTAVAIAMVLLVAHYFFGGLGGPAFVYFRF